MIKLASLAGLSLIALVGASAKWTATLQPKGSAKISGTATLERTETEVTPPRPDSMRPPQPDSVKPSYPSKDLAKASITIKGGDPNASYGWRIHSGSCNAVGATVGMNSTYPDVKVGANGSGFASATISSPIGTGSYSVSVHKAGSMDKPAASGEALACGDFRPGDMP
jgi:hypothetical protein